MIGEVDNFRLLSKWLDKFQLKRGPTLNIFSFDSPHVDFGRMLICIVNRNLRLWRTLIAQSSLVVRFIAYFYLFLL